MSSFAVFNIIYLGLIFKNSLFLIWVNRKVFTKRLLYHNYICHILRCILFIYHELCTAFVFRHSKDCQWRSYLNSLQVFFSMGDRWNSSLIILPYYIITKTGMPEAKSICTYLSTWSFSIKLCAHIFVVHFTSLFKGCTIM